MTKAAIYIRSNTGDHDRQRGELIDKFGDTHEITAEYRDHTSGNQDISDRPGLKRLLEDAAKGEFDVSALHRPDSAYSASHAGDRDGDQKAGVRIVKGDGSEVGIADLFAQAIINQSAKTFVEGQSERIKQGIRAAPERRRIAADAAGAGSGSE